MNTNRFDRASSNLLKLSMFLAVTTAVLVYAGWFALLANPDSVALWCVRIGAVSVGYGALKCFAIQRYMNSNQS